MARVAEFAQADVARTLARCWCDSLVEQADLAWAHALNHPGRVAASQGAKHHHIVTAASA